MRFGLDATLRTKTILSILLVYNMLFVDPFNSERGRGRCDVFLDSQLALEYKINTFLLSVDKTVYFKNVFSFSYKKRIASILNINRKINTPDLQILRKKA